MLPELIAGLLEDTEFSTIAKNAFKGVKSRGKNVVDLLKDASKEKTKELLNKSSSRKIIDNIRKMSKDDKNKLLEGIKKYQNKESNLVEILLNFEGELGLSSSFLQYGIFQLNKENKNEGNLILAIDGKEYDFGKVKTTIWIAMVRAKGKNGSGAGSVLWNTIWYHKRTKSLQTGGVAGSVKNLIKSRRSIYAQLARNQKYINQFEKTKKLFSKKIYYQVPKKPSTNTKSRVRNLFSKFKK